MAREHFLEASLFPVNQFLLTPVRTETGDSFNRLTVYISQTPQVPPFTPYRPIKRSSTYPSYQKILHNLPE